MAEFNFVTYFAELVERAAKAETKLKYTQDELDIVKRDKRALQAELEHAKEEIDSKEGLLDYYRRRNNELENAFRALEKGKHEEGSDDTEGN